MCARESAFVYVYDVMCVVCAWCMCSIYMFVCASLCNMYCMCGNVYCMCRHVCPCMSLCLPVKWSNAFNLEDIKLQKQNLLGAICMYTLGVMCTLHIYGN